MSNFIFTNQFYNDDKGRTLPKARLYFYDNNTFNFTDVYSDPALTQVLDNPVTADGAGRFPQIFMDISKTYRVWLKDRNDVQVTPYIDDYTPQSSISDLGTAAFADLTTSPTDITTGRAVSVDNFQNAEVLGLGVRVILKNDSLSSVSSGAIVDGSTGDLDITKITAAGVIEGAGAATLIGTWKNVAGRTLLAGEFGEFLRVT